MIQEPAVDKLVEKLGSKYAVCVVVSKRAREIMDQSVAQNVTSSETYGKYKAITAAAMEVENGRLTCERE